MAFIDYYKILGVPKDIPQKDVKEAYKKLAKSKFGYITYKNNGQVISTAFNLFMNVTVKYGWGFITVEGVQVPVSTTIEEE